MPSSQLNRFVFRRLIANQPLLYRGCLHRNAPRPLLVPQRRTFLDLFKSQRKIKTARVPPGLETLGELVHMQNEALRLHKPTDVAPALLSFFTPTKYILEDFHVEIALNGFRYLLDSPKPDNRPWFSGDQLEQMLEQLMTRRPHSGGAPHLTLGRLIAAELKRITHIEEEKTTEDTPSVLGEYEVRYVPKLVKLLSMYGAALEARDVVLSTYRNLYEPSQRNNHIPQMVLSSWEHVLQGLALEDKESELLSTLTTMQDLSVPYLQSMQQIVVAYFVAKKDIEQAKHWYSLSPLSDTGAEIVEPLDTTSADILKACALYGDQAFGQQVVTSLLKETPRKEAWDAIFLWSAALGKGPDEIDRMMNVMIRRNNEERQKNPAIPVVQPDTETINALVGLAISKQDSYSAERFVALGEKRGIYPNERTYAMQIQYRLSIKDLDGARAAYFGIQGSTFSTEETVTAVNSLVQALCWSPQHAFDEIMTIVDSLHERNVRLAPETVADLCVLHLRRGEMFDAADLLQVHAHTFSPAQRVTIRKSLAAFIIDGQTSTADAWDTYQLLRKCFPETPRDDRVPIMKEFFARRRSDMACHVFFHMRNSTESYITANKEVYVAAFVGFAQNADAESLELAHNQLKLDLNVELDTQLRNALMLAYACTDNNSHAMEIWAKIGSSKEGPTYNSIIIAFRSCEGMPFGDQHAKSIWRRLKEMDVDIDKKIFTAYLSAIARNHLHDEALALVESAEEEYGYTPDLYILGHMFNATANIDRQAKLEEWIKKNYPSVWTKLEELGHTVTMDGFGYRQFNFNRDLEP
ncbi:complex I intermediate-associated protein-like protein 84 [Periconia macrospinosa]|uniref:Complex I intermediate-associated protein-like protein 84 n=1 Tax=Periconia macrospinosa TaxID=97972 RepID=A0A2V1DAP5_9PLEO|nr:complex I intermediate-associated protein-like protein 84 [Periconia macrospinosa]